MAIDDLAIRNGDFPVRYVSLQEGGGSSQQAGSMPVTSGVN